MGEVRGISNTPKAGEGGPRRRWGRVDVKKLGDRFARRTAQRVNFMRDVHHGLIRLKMPDAQIFLEELEQMFLLDPPPRGA